MTNDLTPLGDDELDALDPETETDPEPDEAQQPSELETLRAEVETLKQNHAVIDDLKRSVGRIQSLATRWETATSAERDQISKQMDDRFSGVDEQIAQLLSGLDETAIDPATKQRILSVRESARRAAELRAAVDEEVGKRIPKAAPQQTSEPTPLENELVNIIAAAGLEPDSQMFDWKGEMSRLAVADPTGALLRKHVMDKVFEARLEDGASTRRTTAKRQAGTGVPKSTGFTISSLDDVYSGYNEGKITGKQYSEYLEKYGVRE